MKWIRKYFKINIFNNINETEVISTLNIPKLSLHNKRL